MPLFLDVLSIWLSYVFHTTKDLAWSNCKCLFRYWKPKFLVGCQVSVNVVCLRGLRFLCSSCRLWIMHSIAMQHLNSGSDSISQVEFAETPLICGLPDDIALSCLARVPRKYHTLLKCVSKRWRDLVCSEEWQSYRLKHKLSETWIYALCRDKFEQVCCYVLDPDSSRRCWKPIQGLPPRTLKRKGIGFEVLGKKVYLLGGCGWSEDASNEVYCYDASGNTWSDASPLATAR